MATFAKAAFERGTNLRAQRHERRPDGGDHRCEQGKDPRDPDRAPVGAQVEARSFGEQERPDGRPRPLGGQHARHSAQRGEQETLDDELPREPEPTHA